MKLKILSALVILLLGFYLPVITGVPPLILKVSAMVWGWLLLNGLLAKIILQSFASPFLSRRSDEHLSMRKQRLLNTYRNMLICLGIGYFIGEVWIYQTIGTVSIGILLYALGVHIGTHYINTSKYYFNQ